MAWLALIEGRRLVRHPAFLAAGGLALLASVVPGRWGNIFEFSPFSLLASGTLVASALGALRSRREGTDELFTSTCVVETRRIAAHVLAAVVATAAAIGLFAAVDVYWSVHYGFPLISRDQLQWWSQQVAAVFEMGAIGVLLARRLPSVVTGPSMALPLLVLQPAIGWWWNGVGWRWFVPLLANTQPGEPTAALGWHALYLFGIGVLIGRLAVGGSWRRFLPNVALLLGAAATVLGGALQTATG